MKTKTALENTKATLKGVKKVAVVSVGVIEAFSWLTLIGLGFMSIWERLKNESINLNHFWFWLVAVATAVIAIRCAYEGARYFRNVGDEYER